MTRVRQFLALGRKTVSLLFTVALATPSKRDDEIMRKVLNLMEMIELIFPFMSMFGFGEESDSSASDEDYGSKMYH